MSRDELIQQYEAGGPMVSLAIRALTREDLLCPVDPGRWSIQHVVIHLADSELVFAERIKRVIAEAPRPALPAFDENRWLAALATDERSAEDAGALIEMTRRDTARILRSAPAEAFDRVGVHSAAGEQTLAAIVTKAVNHLEHHLKFIHGKRATMGKEMW